MLQSKAVEQLAEAVSKLATAITEANKIAQTSLLGEPGDKLPSQSTKVDKEAPAKASQDKEESKDKEEEYAAERNTACKKHKLNYQELADIYMDALPALRQPNTKVWGEATKRIVRSRWYAAQELESSEHGKKYKDLPRNEYLDMWRRYFESVNDMPHLMGDNNRGWQADMVWLLRPSNFEKVIQGNYTR